MAHKISDDPIDGNYFFFYILKFSANNTRTFIHSFMQSKEKRKPRLVRDCIEILNI